MAISVILSDGEGRNGSVKVLKKDDMVAGIAVYTSPIKDFVHTKIKATHPTYGTQIARDARFSGTPDVIHNGTDTVAWTGSNLSGTNFVFDSTTVAQAGTKSISATATVNNNEALLTRGSALTVASYVGITGYVYTTSWGVNSNIQIFARLAGVVVSSTVNLSNYIIGTSYGTWQKFAIPFSALAFTSSTFDQLVIRTIGSGGSTPDYYLDTLQVEESAGASIYSITPQRGHILSLDTLTIAMVDAYDTTLASNSVSKISYNKFLNLSALTTGIQVVIYSKGDVLESDLFKHHLDIVSYPNCTYNIGADATNAYIVYTIKFPHPIELDARVGDKVEITISENLSDLLSLEITGSGGEVDPQTLVEI